MAEKEQQVGIVANFFARPSVAAVKVTEGSIKKGDVLRFSGHTTEFTDKVLSMQVNNQPVDEAKPGDFIGIKVSERVRENDKVYKVIE